jgi:hypothetical protein
MKEADRESQGSVVEHMRTRESEPKIAGKHATSH